MDEIVRHPLKKKKFDFANAENQDSSTFSNLIDNIFFERLPEWVEENSISYVFGDDIEKMISHIYKYAVKRNGIHQTDKALKLFTQLKHYYRFYIDESNIAYCSKFVPYKDSMDTLEDFDAVFSKILKDCLKELNVHTYNYKGSPEKLFNILLLHLRERHRQFELQLQEKIIDTSKKTMSQISNKEKKKYNVELNDFLKSELKTWNQKMLHENNDYHFGAYPYCKFIKLNSQYIILLIVSYLDKKYINEKIEDLDIIEPVHLLIFDDKDSIFDMQFLDELGFKLKHIVGNINYGQLGFVTNTSLKVMVEESAETARYWYTEGVNQIFNEKELLNSDQHKGLMIAQTVIDKLLCSDLNSMITTEGFPFNRIFLFPDSNFRSAKLSNDIDFDPGIPNDKNVLEMIVFEAGFKSNRPQDNERYLSNMERFDKTEDDPMKDLEVYFDITDKKIIYTSRLKIDKEGNLYSNSWITNGDNEQRERPKINFFDHLHEETQTEDDKKLNFQVLKDFDLKKETINDYNRLKIEAVLASLFVGLYDKTDDGIDDDDKSSACQSTYNLYNEDGLCGVADHSVNIRDIPLLFDIQQAYFDEFFASNKEKWEKIIWKDNKTNHPDKEAFSEWLNTVESKVNIISFDPNQSAANLNELDGSRYIANVGFTIVFVADNDIKKNIYNNKTETLDLNQAFTMIIRRLLQEEKNKKTAIRETNELYKTLLPSILHSAKGYIQRETDRKKIDEMHSYINRLLETENIKLDVLNINKVNDVYKHFFECLITDKNSNTKSERISEPIDYSFKWVSQEMEKAALNYLVLLEKSDKGKMEMNLNLDFHFNFNFIPAVKMTANLPFLEEAMKVIFNNAMQHTRLYAIKKRCNPQIIISINISEHPTDLNRGFLEITFINRSEPIDQDRLDQVNNPKPRRLTKDLRKESSTGIGLFISRIQLKRTSGEGANIILKNLKEDLVEVKLVLPVTMQKTYEGIANIQNKKVTKPNLVQNYKILYVEDEPKKRESSMKVLKKLLKANSTFVCSTDNYTDASTIVQEQDLILVLMDFNILSKRGGNTADSKPGIKLINKIRTKNPDLPIVILSAASFSDIQQGLEEAKIDVSNLIEWHLSNRNSLIEPGKIYKTLFKDLADPGSKFLLQSVLHYFNENAQTSAENQSVSSFIEKEYRYTLATLDKFSTAFNAYRNRCIRKEEIDELLIFQSKASSIEELLTCIKNWISIEDQQSIHIDDLEDNSKEKIFRNEYVRSIIQVIIVDNSLFKNVPVSLRYWAQTLNIFITTTQDPARTLVQHWPEIPFGLRGALSKLRHGVSNKITGKDLSTLLEYIQITEKLLLIMGSLKSFSEFENIVKRSIEEAKKLIKEEPVRKNEEIVSKLNALSDELKKNYNLEEVGEFVKTIEDLKLLLGI